MWIRADLDPDPQPWFSRNLNRFYSGLVSKVKHRVLLWPLQRLSLSLLSIPLLITRLNQGAREKGRRGFQNIKGILEAEREGREGMRLEQLVKSSGWVLFYFMLATCRSVTTTCCQINQLVQDGASTGGGNQSAATGGVCSHSHTEVGKGNHHSFTLPSFTYPPLPWVW